MLPAAAASAWRRSRPRRVRGALAAAGAAPGGSGWSRSRAGGDHQRTSSTVLSLAHVARPGVGLDPRRQVAIDPRRIARPWRGELRDQVLGQRHAIAARARRQRK
jgi:hypothetical protein